LVGEEGGCTLRGVVLLYVSKGWEEVRRRAVSGWEMNGEIWSWGLWLVNRSWRLR